MSDPAAVQQLAEGTGDVALLCSNAGVTTPPGLPLWEATPQDWSWVLGVNLLGLANAVRSFVPRMVSAGRPGWILITSSMAGIESPPHLGPYVAAKHAALAVGERLAAELEAVSADVHVGVACPWLVRTGILDRPRPGHPVDDQGAATALHAQLRKLVLRAADPDDTAEALLRGLAGRARYLFTGVDGADSAARRAATMRASSFVAGRGPQVSPGPAP